MMANEIGLRMYEEREKPKENIKANNRPVTRHSLTKKAHKFARIDDGFVGHQTNGLLQKQDKTRVNAYIARYFRPQSNMIQRMAVSLPAAQMLALLSRLIAGLAGGAALQKSLEALHKSPEFEQMTDMQKMTVYSVLYKVANNPKLNKTETLPAEFDAHSTTDGSEMVEKGITTRSLPMTDQAILDLLGPIPASDDMVFNSSTSLPIVDDLGKVYSQRERNRSILKAESKALDGSADTIVRSDIIGKTATTQSESVVPDTFKYADGVAFRSDLNHHLVKFDGLEKHGVKGAHNLSEFLSLEKSHGINILSRTEVGNGIYQIEYQIPKYFGNNKEAAKFGKSAGDFSHFKTAKDPKTVYDPAVWAGEAFLEFSQKAASQSFSANAQKFIANDKARIYNTTYEGMDFRVYLDKDDYGNVFVDNIHPRGKE